MDTILAAIIGGLLYRLRGGGFSNAMRALYASTGSQVALWLSKQRTQTMRALWALPTGLLLYLATGGAWWMLPILIVSVFLSLALYGHGAHMVYDTKQFIAFSKNKTELLTEWWLPQVFGGIPDATWPDSKTALYNLAGMSFIGLARNTTAIIPVATSHEIPALIYALTGLLHGPLYLAGWRINGTSATSEVLVGATTWFTIVLLYG